MYTSLSVLNGRELRSRIINAPVNEISKKFMLRAFDQTDGFRKSSFIKIGPKNSEEGTDIDNIVKGVRDLISPDQGTKLNDFFRFNAFYNYYAQGTSIQLLISNDTDNPVWSESGDQTSNDIAFSNFKDFYYLSVSCPESPDTSEQKTDIDKVKATELEI